MGKKYFIQDAEIRNVDEDYFRHDDLASNMRHILKGNEAPYNIAVIGKWGLGKSSLINLALKEFEHNEDYLFVTINAWKYEKESLSKVFLRQVMEQLDDKNPRETQQEKVERSLGLVLKGLFKKKSPTTDSSPKMCKTVWQFIRKYWTWIVGYILGSFLFYLTYKVIVAELSQQSLWDSFFWLRVFAGYMRNSVLLVVVPAVVFILTKIGFDFEKHPITKMDFQLPEMNVEDYEIELAKAINKKRKDIKIVIVVDDLDRLSAEKMVEALDAIKMFINFSNCIFIVPFDDSIIKKAIYEYRLKDKGNSSVLADSEQFLDKLFQYKLYLSPLLDYDIKEYAKKLCNKNLKDFYMEYCPREIFLKVLERVIIYPGVTTPRQVKKLVNTFISYMMLAKSREKSGKLNAGFSSETEGIFTIAKLSVLQADFNDFYDLLFEEDGAIDEVLKYYEEFNSTGLTDQLQNLPDEIQKVLEIDGNGAIPKSSEPLINFLILTRNIGKRDILPYLYVAEDDIVRQTGNREQKDFIRAASSGNIIESRKAMAAQPKLVLSARRFINASNDRTTLLNMVKVMLGIEDVVDAEGKTIIADVLAERSIDIVSYWEEGMEEPVGASGLLGYYDYAENKDAYNKLLDCVLKEVTPTKENAAGMISSFMEHRESLPEKTLMDLESFITESIRNGAVSFESFKDVRLKFKLETGEWMREYYDSIVGYIVEQEDFSHETLEELRTVYKILSDNGDDSAFEGLEQLFDKTEMTTTFIKLLKLDGSERVSEGTICDLLIRQIEAGSEKDALNELIADNGAEFEESNLAIVDNYMMTQAAEEMMPKMLERYLEYNDIDGIPLTASAIIEEAFSNRSDSGIKSVKRLMDEKSSAVTQQIVDGLTTACAYNKSDYSKIDELLSYYAKIDADAVIKIITPGISISKDTKLSDAFILFMTDFMLDVKSDGFQDIIHKYVQSLMQRIKSHNQNANAIIRSLNMLDRFMSDEEFKSVQPSIHKNVNSVNVANVYQLYNKRYKIFGNNEGELKLNDHVDICLKMIEEGEMINDAIGKLNEKYSFISEIERFAHAINTAKVNQDMAFDTLAKFIKNGIEKSGAEVSTVKALYGILNEEGIEFFNNACETKGDLRQSVSKIIVQSKAEFTFDEISLLLEWMLSKPVAKGENIGVDDLVSALLNMLNFKDQAEKVLKLIEIVPKDAFNEKKTKYISIYVELLRKNYSPELNAAIIMQARGRSESLARKVVEAAPESMNEELTEYLKKKK